ncbi:MAG: hypothetical protein AB9869_02010 [Verrucomicrobiia bacterium]
MNLAKANRLLPGQTLAVVLAAASLVTAEVSAQFQAPPGVFRRAEAPPGTDWVRAGLNTLTTRTTNSKRGEKPRFPFPIVSAYG